MCLAALNTIVTSAKNPKSWEKFINHNWPLVAGISGLLAICSRLIAFPVLWVLTNPKDVRTNLSDPVHNIIRLRPNNEGELMMMRLVSTREYQKTATYQTAYQDPIPFRAQNALVR
jgi:hypothetical protein